jgi:hypothetical protein
MEFTLEEELTGTYAISDSNQSITAPKLPVSAEWSLPSAHRKRRVIRVSEKPTVRKAPAVIPKT